MEHDRGIGQHELEVVYHVDGARIALFGRFHHGAAHDLLKADRDHLVDLAGFLGRGLDLLDGDADGGVAVKGQGAREHFIEHDAHGVDVRLLVGVLAARLLGADIVDRADGLVGHGDGFKLGDAGDAEVHDLDGAVAEDHDVLRLDVTVDDAALMRMLQGAENLHRDLDRDGIGDGFLGADKVLEGDAVYVLHDDVLQVALELKVNYAHDIAVAQHGDGARFVEETPPELFVRHKFVLHDFDRDVVAGHAVGRAVHDGHAAAADHILQHVPVFQNGAGVSIHLNSTPSLKRNGSK